MARSVFLFIFLTTLTVPSAEAGSYPCTPDGVCTGDSTYAYVHGKVLRGKVSGASYDSVTFDTAADGEITVNAADVAIAKPGNCYGITTDYCVGNGSSRTNKKGDKVSGSIVAFFPATGFVLLNEGGKLSSIQKDLITPVSRFPIEGAVAPDPAPDAAMKQAVAVAAAAPAVVHAAGAAADNCPPEAVVAKPSPSPSPSPAAVPENPLMQVAQAAKQGQPLTVAQLSLLWNGSAKPVDTNPWQACLDPSEYDHPVKLRSASGRISPLCAPDTLYSWGPMVKIQDLQAQIGDGKWKNNPFYNDALYLSHSPLSSFGYGSSDETGGYAIRVKLRPGTRVVLLDSAQTPDCTTFPKKESDDTVYIRIFINNHGGAQSSGEDYVLCSSKPIESWSYGTRGFYDELVRDVNRVTSPAHPDDWLSYMRRPDASGTFEPAIWNIGSDSHPFTQEQLIETMEKQLLLAADQKGRIYVNPDAPGTEKQKRDDHFKTAIPNWFDPGD
jgi:hypothetical protein